MQVSVENVSSVERRLTIVVPADQLEEAYTKQIHQIARNASIKGFRPGKAPMSYIEKQFGHHAREEALSEIIKKTLYEAIAANHLRPVSTPKVEPKITVPNQPLEFIASFEVLPDITNIHFTMNNIEKLMVDIEDKDVDRVIEQLKKQYAKWNPVDRTAQEKDRVVIDYISVFEGKADTEHKIQNFPVELGSHTMLPGFEEGLMGSKAEDERTLSLTFPADFGVAERAGKPVDFVVHIKQVFEAEMPHIDEHFIQKLGIKSGKEEELREQIKHSLLQERDRLVKENLKEQVFRQLLEQNPMEVPHSLVVQEAKRIHDELYPKHQHHDHQHSDDEIAVFNDTAKKRVSLGLLIAAYAKQAELKADKDRVHKRIQEIASAYEQPQEVVTWLSSDERRQGIEAQVMEDQVLDKLIEGVPAIDKRMTYAELKGIRI